MCDSVWTQPDGLGALSNVGDLIGFGLAVLPEDIAPELTGMFSFPQTLNFCLCCVDVETVLERSGYTFEWTPEGEYVLR